MPNEDPWDEIRRLASSENEYEREGALQRARLRVEERLQQLGYMSSEGGVKEQLQKYAADHRMAESEVSVIIAGLKYRNKNEHDGMAAGQLGVLTTVLVMHAFCDPQRAIGAHKNGMTLGQLLAKLGGESADQVPDFFEFFQEELTWHEKQSLERACDRGLVTVRELHLVLSQPRVKWKNALATVVGTESHPRSFQERLDSFVAGANAGSGPETATVSKVAESLSGWLGESRSERKAALVARKRQLEELRKQRREVAASEKYYLLKGAILFVVGVLVLMAIGELLK